MMAKNRPRYFHLHLISDATGETLTAVAKAAAVQYSHTKPIEHVHPLVRTVRQLTRVLQEVEAAPGIVLYTLVNEKLRSSLELRCKELNLPCLPVLDSVLQVFGAYLGTSKSPTVAAQHALDTEYFRRIDALNFTLIHDDGQLPEDLDQADIVIVGISRTSKTPTAIYLANRGFKTANVPIVLNIPMPKKLEKAGPTTLVTGLIASPERIAHVRRHRIQQLGSTEIKDYADPDMIKQEITFTKKLCAQNRWPIIDVTRRSIEETAAAIQKLYHDRHAKQLDAKNAT